MTTDELRQLDADSKREIDDLHQRISTIARNLIEQTGHQCTCKESDSPCPLCRLKDLVAEIDKNPWPLM